MDKKIEAAIRETLVVGNPVSIKRCVDKLKLIFEQEQALRQANVSGSLPLEELAEKIIDSLDDCTKEYNYREYGLPWRNDKEMGKMKAIVVQLLGGNGA